MVKLTLGCFIATCLMTCSGNPESPQMVDEWPQIYPYYVNVTIPAGMSPLNFSMIDSQVASIDVEVRGSNGGRMHVSGKQAVFNAGEWKKLTTQNVGYELTFTVRAQKQGQWVQYRDFKVNIR